LFELRAHYQNELFVVVGVNHEFLVAELDEVRLLIVDVADVLVLDVDGDEVLFLFPYPAIV
jgi:hypothetical protein